MDKRKIYCFIGLPASGKGTQAAEFAKKRGLTQIGIGDLVREQMAKELDDDITRRIKAKYNEGQPVDNDIVFELIKNKLASIETGIVFDNFPFTEEQSKLLDQFIDENDWQDPTIIYIDVDPEVCITRMSTRSVCPQCKKIFAGGVEECDECHVPTFVRADDNEETVRKRIEQYVPNIEKMISIYEPRGEVARIDGMPSVPEVEAQIAKIQ